MDEGIFDCSICADKLDEAMETNCCHHCYCRQCIEDWMRAKKSCPSCRKALTNLDLVPNVPIQRMINNLPIECPNIKRGCDSKLTRGIVKDHLLNSCEFVQILCTNDCGLQVFKIDLVSHQRDTCPKRLTPCLHCALMIKLDSIIDHMNTCPKVLILCPNCKALVARENLQRHHRLECTKIELTCPFKQFGCQFKGFRSEHNKHMIEDSDLHVGIVIEREARMTDEISNLKNELEQYKNKLNDIFGFNPVNSFKFGFDPKPEEMKPKEKKDPEYKIGFKSIMPQHQPKKDGFVFQVPNDAPQPQRFPFDFGPDVQPQPKPVAPIFTFGPDAQPPPQPQPKPVVPFFSFAPQDAQPPPQPQPKPVAPFFSFAPQDALPQPQPKPVAPFFSFGPEVQPPPQPQAQPVVPVFTFGPEIQSPPQPQPKPVAPFFSFAPQDALPQSQPKLVAPIFTFGPEVQPPPQPQPQPKPAGSKFNFNLF